MKKFRYTNSYNLGRPVGAHIAIAEKAFGGPLPKGSIVHHWDENGLNNEPSNLLVCPDEAYHNLIHRRMRAHAACGRADYQHCQYCDMWADVSELTASQKSDRPSVTYFHAECRSLYVLNLKLRKKNNE